MRDRLVILLAISLTGCLSIIGCRSAHVDVSIENHTGAVVRLLEVSYPSATFGVGTLADGAALHNRIQLRGDGPIRLTFANAKDQSTAITGPQLAENQNGSLQVVLLAGGKAEFHPNLNSPR